MTKTKLTRNHSATLTFWLLMMMNLLQLSNTGRKSQRRLLPPASPFCQKVVRLPPSPQRNNLYSRQPTKITRLSYSLVFAVSLFQQVECFLLSKHKAEMVWAGCMVCANSVWCPIDMRYSLRKVETQFFYHRRPRRFQNSLSRCSNTNLWLYPVHLLLSTSRGILW